MSDFETVKDALDADPTARTARTWPSCCSPRALGYDPEALAALNRIQQENERLRAENLREPKPDAVLVDGVRLDQLRRIEEAARALSEVVEEAESVGICLPTRAEALALRAALDQEVKG